MKTEKETILREFGKHVKSIRINKDLSQDQVVINSIRITKGTISDIENGKRNFSFTTLRSSKRIRYSSEGVVGF